MTPKASCSCGQLRVTVEGEPVRVSVCHCLAWQQRTGSAFGYQARFTIEGFEVEGEFKEHVRYSDEGEERRSSFCAECGSRVFWKPAPEFVAIAVGAFADPSFPPPWVEVYESLRHAWVQMPDGITPKAANELRQTAEQGPRSRARPRRRGRACTSGRSSSGRRGRPPHRSVPRGSPCAWRRDTRR